MRFVGVFRYLLWDLWDFFGKSVRNFLSDLPLDLGNQA